MRKPPNIVPILLAAGASRRLPFAKPLAPFAGKTALEIALENCAGLAKPIVVLGHQAATVRAGVPAGVRTVVNRPWRSGQLGSLLAGLRRLPPGAAFMLYPVDLPLLTPAVIRRLVKGFKNKLSRHLLVVPTHGHRQGHPVVFSSEMRPELATARTAKEVVKRDPGRVKLVSVRTPAIWQDFSTPASYRRCLDAYRRRRATSRRQRPTGR